MASDLQKPLYIRMHAARSPENRQEPFCAQQVPLSRFIMLGQSSYSRAVSANVADIERRLHALERNLERVGSRTAASATATADELRESIGSALAGLVDRFRGSADSLSRNAARMGDTAAKAGTDALRRLSDEVEHRPLVTLAVAVGVGFLLGVVSQRR